jgi:hypothetical protein
MRYWQEYNRRKEEGGNVGPFQRQEEGFGVMPVAAVMDMETIYSDFQTNTVNRKVVRMDLKATAFWFSGSTFFPLGKSGPKSAYGITWMVTGSLFGFKSDAIADGSGGYSKFDIQTMQMGIPLGLEYKSGCDAVLNKSLRSCYSIGAGVNPLMNISTIGLEAGGAMLSARPYVKAEFGFFAGLCFKLRGMYTIGKLKYVDIQDAPGMLGRSSDLTSVVVKDRTPGTFAISLVIMGLSFDWEDSRIY